MQKYPFLNSAATLETFFNILRNTKIPPKFTYRHLADIGFSSSNDRRYIPLLLFLGFISSSSVPTNIYHSFVKEENYKAILFLAISESYSEIFNINKNVPNLPDDELIQIFSKYSNESLKVYQKQAITFKSLCLYADLNTLAEIPGVSRKNTHISPKDLKLNINIPATTDERVYQVLFKHLKDLLTYQDQ